MHRAAAAWKPILTVCLVCFTLSSCLVRRRVITRQGKQEIRPLLTATKDQLIERINAVSSPIATFSSTVDITPSLGSVYQGELKDYATLRGYILFRKPDDIRIIGLDPVIHSKAFDMVSTGPDFRLYVPIKNRFVEGRNDAPPSGSSKNKLENLRPSAFLTSLLIYPPNPKTETSLLEDDTDEDHAWYILLIIHRDHGELRLGRSIYFDRYTLQIVRQKTLDAGGGTLSDARYSQWKVYAGVPFPSEIDISRPQDGYEVALSVVNMKMNAADVGPEKFVLEQPAGTQLQQIK